LFLLGAGGVPVGEDDRAEDERALPSLVLGYKWRARLLHARGEIDKVITFADHFVPAHFVPAVSALGKARSSGEGPAS
jgi:hypothetical protein